MAGSATSRGRELRGRCTRGRRPGRAVTADQCDERDRRPPGATGSWRRVGGGREAGPARSPRGAAVTARARGGVRRHRTRADSCRRVPPRTYSPARPASGARPQHACGGRGIAGSAGSVALALVPSITTSTAVPAKTLTARRASPRRWRGWSDGRRSRCRHGRPGLGEWSWRPCLHGTKSPVRPTSGLDRNSSLACPPSGLHPTPTRHRVTLGYAPGPYGAAGREIRSRAPRRDA